MVDNPENPMPKQQIPRKSPQSEQLIRGMLEENKKFRQERRRKVAVVKQNAPDKQPFDIEAFGNMYNLRDDDGNLRVTPEVVEDFEAEYYLKNPDLKSMQEFVDRRRELDSQDSG